MAEGKHYAAVATFAQSDEASTIEVPGDVAEVIAALDEIVAKYDMGDAISEEDQAIVKAYLPAIGVDSSELSQDNALVGEGSYAFDKSELGCDLHAEGRMGCRGAGEGRIEWWADMAVSKTGGEARIANFKFTFQGAGFGVGPTGVMKLIYKRDFSRDFGASDSAAASFFDRYTLTQWGFYYTSTCEVLTEKGTIVVR